MNHRKSNPPIPGHELHSEGWIGVRLYAGDRYRLFGGCRCGALPDGIDREGSGRPQIPSQNAIKRWHRQHKADIRSRKTTS